MLSQTASGGVSFSVDVDGNVVIVVVGNMHVGCCWFRFFSGWVRFGFGFGNRLQFKVSDARWHLARAVANRGKRTADDVKRKIKHSNDKEIPKYIKLFLSISKKIKQFL